MDMPYKDGREADELDYLARFMTGLQGDQEQLRVIRAEYDNLIGSWNVSPRLFWSQDVHGTTPGPSGNFIQGRYTTTAGLNGTLHNTYEVDLSYTHFGGAGVYNPLNDRDFFSASVKFSF